MAGLTTGALARAAGVHVETLRYYERRGLLPEPPRRPSGYREYPESAVGLVRFIRRAQALGFTLREIEELLTLREATDCTAVRRIAEQKLQDIEGRLRDLERLRAALAELTRRCREEGGPGRCPVVEALSEAG
ncbi:MAG: MerR family transcriptional regulator [Nitrospirae bacterium]|nr:MAG: MerR family transcriptional regulator [Nitrospirota bacterium]